MEWKSQKFIFKNKNYDYLFSKIFKINPKNNLDDLLSICVSFLIEINYLIFQENYF